MNHAELFRVGREGTLKVIMKAMNNEPGIDCLFENQDTVAHSFHQLGTEGKL